MTYEQRVTPFRQSYLEIREQVDREHPGSVVFTRLGDFYELFDQDARIGAEVLDLTLTSRPIGIRGSKERIDMAGVPYHRIDEYAHRLVATGLTVVIVEPTHSNQMFPLTIARVISPDSHEHKTLTEQQKRSEFLSGLAQLKDVLEQAGVLIDRLNDQYPSVMRRYALMRRDIEKCTGIEDVRYSIQSILLYYKAYTESIPQYRAHYFYAPEKDESDEAPF